jgi:hypothetical protein
MMCDAALPMVWEGASCCRAEVSASRPISDGLGPFQRLPASELSRRWGCDGWPSVDPPHLAALSSDDGGKSPSWLGLEDP